MAKFLKRRNHSSGYSATEVPYGIHKEIYVKNSQEIAETFSSLLTLTTFGCLLT